MNEYSYHYNIVERALEHIAEHRIDQPELPEIARHLRMSPSHFQRLFVRWAGVSPKKFLQFITLEHAKEELRRNSTVEDAAFSAGLSGTGRLHDLFVGIEGVTPGEFKNGGERIKIEYGIFDGPFGRFLLACIGKKICKLDFLDDERAGRRAVREEWPNASVVHAPGKIRDIAAAVFGSSRKRTVTVLARGTPFQLKVWEALLKIPEGQLTSYEKIAEAVGSSRAPRAVGLALARNPVAYLIPCHRVIRKVGRFGEYRWGSIRKQAMIGWEGVRAI